MSLEGASPTSLVEERVAQLQHITERRNVLLKEMYQMLQRRGDVGAVFDPRVVQDQQGLNGFLDRFSLLKNPRGASISNLPESAFFLPPLQTISISADIPVAPVASTSTGRTATAASHIFDGALSSPEEEDKMEEEPASEDLQLTYPPTSSTPMEVDARASLAPTPRVEAMNIPLPGFNFVPQPRPPLPLPSSSAMDAAPPTHNPLKRKAGPPALTPQRYAPNYTLPPLSQLPAEFTRKKGVARLQRKKEKERAQSGGIQNDKKDREDWVPMGLNKWSATLNANPMWKKLSKATKCLSTREWSVAFTELKLIRTLERVDVLKDAKEGNWSFRQPKKQRVVGVMAKTHWDHLLDEMRWMRTDFREERKWKLALAYNLGTAVLEWHAAETREGRVEQGIIIDVPSPPFQERRLDDDPPVKSTWEPPTHDDYLQMQMEANFPPPPEPMVVDMPLNVMSMVDYPSDDEDDEEQEKDVAHALEPSVLEETLMHLENSMSMPPVEPKLEDEENRATLEASMMQVDGEQPEPSREEDEGAAGLKNTSTDPVLGASTPETLVVSKSSPKTNVYSHLRERIAYSALSELFIDITNLDSAPTPAASQLTDETPEGASFEAPPPPADLSSIFPDLQAYGMMPIGFGETKRKTDRKYDKDDLTKRPDDLIYTKLAPIGRFMYSKPTLLGALQPAKKWKNGKWEHLDDTPIFPEGEGPPIRPENHMCALFEAIKLEGQPSRNSPMFNPMYFPRPPLDPAKRNPDHLWLPHEDDLLRDLVVKYPGNWYLVADAFNSLRVTISTDKRSTWDCFERWNVKWGNGSRLPPLPGAPPAQAQLPGGSPLGSEMSPPPSRGVPKRNTIVALGGGASIGGEPRKQRRHALMFDTIRKASKKRDSAAKATQTQRKPPNMHDTHAQYSKLPQYSPTELSRMKYDKELQDQARRRADEAQRQHMLQQARQQQQQAMAQMHMQAEGSGAGGPPPPNGQPRPAPGQFPQVNISQQRMSPQQALQAHAQAAQAQAQSRAVQAAQAQVQAQAQYHQQGAQPRALTSSPAVAHASPVQASQSPRPPSQNQRRPPAQAYPPS